ncbi:MAG: glycosyltransferase family 2 protein [Candidatus Lokiarchaeota archaeon]|nr:glycosyltransferase family 2 protein [Candidatus Lokiarchaeota archaeon]
MIENRKIATIIPAFNEEKLVNDTLQGIPEYIDKIIIVDDGSTDRTPHIVKMVKDPRVKLVRHQKNKGVGGAIVSGYKICLKLKYDISIILAGDNQMDPKYIPNLCRPIINGEADYVKGNRLTGSDGWKGMTKFRLFGNLVLSYITKIASGYWHIMDPQNGYTAISYKALSLLNLNNISRGYVFENDILIKLSMKKLKVVNVSIPAKYGEEESKIKYNTFIIKTSRFLLKSYILRLNTKYSGRLR